MKEKLFGSLLLAACRLKLVARGLPLVACGLQLAARNCLALAACSLPPAPGVSNSFLLQPVAVDAAPDVRGRSVAARLTSQGCPP